jgi:4-hydroxythreonine-4-phosphate dehydrogenase
MKRPVRIGISAGDLNGIGPEVALKALTERPVPDNLRAVLIGSPSAFATPLRQLRLPPLPAWSPADGPPTAPVSLWNPAPRLAPVHRPGQLTVSAARAAHAWICAGVTACLDQTLDGLVTAPISKEGFHRAGINVPGHTELLADLTGAKKIAMMLYGGPLRVVLATRHIPIAAVPGALNRPLIRDTLHQTDTALRWMGLRRRRIAVCGLNPHAGEGGDIGHEDRDLIAPAVRAAQRAGLDAHGPLPGDTVFHAAARGDYDAVIAMYHDQGLAPLKLIAFDTGVNLTLGLPIVRTSPDHGTAFAIAGTNRADPSSMASALEQAHRLAQRPNPWRQGG